MTEVEGSEVLSPGSDAAHFALFPFVEKLGKNRRAVLLPRHHKPRLVRIAEVFYVTEDEDPALAKVFIQLAARAYFRR